jgi:alpha/beta superfamily hydrolase
MTNEEKVRFPNGEILLEGRLARPAEAQRAVVVCHPHPQYGGTMENNVVEAVTRRLLRDGFATLRFNFRGVGGSEGSYGNLLGECDDARAAVRFIRERTGFETVILAGYSFGAVVALQAGYDDSSVERLIAIAPPLSMFDLGFLRGCEKPKLLLVGEHDQYCPLDVFDRGVALLAAPTSCVRLPGADHFFLGDEEELAAHVARFASSP